MSATEREKTTKPGDEKNKIRASNTYYSVAVTAEGAKILCQKVLTNHRKRGILIAPRTSSLFETTKNKPCEPAEAKLIWHKDANRHDII